MSAAEDFEEFVAIVEHGSITAAAAALEVPRPTVSRRLARLEERLGVRLLHRTTRQLELTRQGARLFERARPVVLAAREAEAAVRRIDDVPRGLLRISVPTSVPPIFAVWMSDFVTRYPEVRLEVVASEAHVDLVGGGFDVALRRGDIEDGSLVARRITTNDDIAVASPEYLGCRGTPTCPSELSEHHCLVSYRMGVVPLRRWPLFDGGSVEVSGPLASNQNALRLGAALTGLGIAMVAEPQAREHIEAGRLVHVLPGVLGRTVQVNLVYTHREHLEPKVRAFVDHVIESVKLAHQGDDRAR